jgi:predicted nucleotidyltransferase
VNGNQSPWADEERWRERLDADGLRVAELLDADDREVVEGAVAAAAVNHALDFLVVYGSVARGERHADSDLDLYFEARDLPREVNLTDEGRRWHVFGVPSGALLDDLRRSHQFAFDLIASALIITDSGSFRDVLITADVEGLAPEVQEDSNGG